MAANGGVGKEVAVSPPGQKLGLGRNASSSPCTVGGPGGFRGAVRLPPDDPGCHCLILKSLAEDPPTHTHTPPLGTPMPSSLLSGLGSWHWPPGQAASEWAKYELGYGVPSVPWWGMEST